MVMAPASPLPAWSVAVRLRHRGGLEIRASAENVLPGWGCGGERLSLLLRLRRRLILAVTSQCGPRASAPGTPPPRGCRIALFLRSRWSRITPIWRRKNPPPVRAASAAPGPRPQQNRSLARMIQRSRAAWTPTEAATLWFGAAAAMAIVLVSIAAFYLKGGHWGGGCREPIAAHCASWRCFLAQFLEPPSLSSSYWWLLRLLKQRLLSK